MNELLPGIFTWTWFSDRHGYDFNGWFVREGRLAVDPVVMPDAVLDELAAKSVERIVLTNRNHFRAAAALRARTGARVAVHPADAGFVRKQGVEVDDDLVHGSLAGPFAVLDARGKSPGEIALWWPERRILIVGDACVGKPPGALALLPANVIGDLPTLQRSLQRLAGLDAEAVLVGDGTPIVRDGAAALRALVETFR